MSHIAHKNEGAPRTKTVRFYHQLFSVSLRYTIESPLDFLHTGKEKDTMTGYGYFGARYMDHELMTMWLSVDPLAKAKDNGILLWVLLQY